MGFWVGASVYKQPGLSLTCSWRLWDVRKVQFLHLKEGGKSDLCLTYVETHEG